MITSWHPDWHPRYREQQVISPTDSQNSTQLLLSCHVFPFFLWLKCTCHCKRRNSSPDSLGMSKFSASSLSLGSNRGDWGAQISERMKHPGRLHSLQPQTIPIPILEFCWSLTTSLFPNNFFSAEAHFPFETKSSSLSWSFTMEMFCTHPRIVLGFPGGSEVNASACNVGDLGLIPGLGISPGEGNGNLLQYSCLENPMDGRAWWATVHGVAESDTIEWLHSLHYG